MVVLRAGLTAVKNPFLLLSPIFLTGNLSDEGEATQSMDIYLNEYGKTLL